MKENTTMTNTNRVDGIPRKIKVLMYHRIVDDERLREPIGDRSPVAIHQSVE